MNPCKVFYSEAQLVSCSDFTVQFIQYLFVILAKILIYLNKKLFQLCRNVPHCCKILQQTVGT